MTDKLIPMTDWVIENYPKNPQGHQSYLFGKHAISYAKFLKQPLTIGMFVPVSEAGEVLQEPEMYMAIQNLGSMNSHATEQDCVDAENYHAAKSRCLFEGFVVIGEGYDDGRVVELEMTGNNIWLTFLDGKPEATTFDGHQEEEIESIEQLMEFCNYNGNVSLTLTPYAKELIYGN